MAITKRQYPTSKIIGYIYPNYYTATSTNSSYSNFKYKYEVNYVNGVLSTHYILPHLTNTMGIFNPNLIIKNLFTNIDFNMNATTWTRCPNSIYNIRIDVEESGTGSGEANFNKIDVIKSSDKDFNYINFMLNGNTKSFLTNYNSVRKVTTDSRDLLRFFNGKISTYYSSPYQIYLEITRNNQTYVYISANNNPYFTAAQAGENADNMILENKQNYLLYFGTGPYNIENSIWKYVLRINENGFLIPQPGNVTPITFQVGDRYSIYAYNSGQKSKKINYEIICDNNETFQIFWENRYGGFDSHIFNKRYDKTLNIEKSTYRKNNYIISGYNVIENTNSGGLTVYHNNIETTYHLTTDWLSKSEILDLEDLWISKNVFMRIDNDIYPVVSLNTEQQINRTQKGSSGLRQYEISVVLSNKKYN